MNTAHIAYLGALRTEATHLRSGNSLITDAPLDNNGKGEAFSPTDLLAASLVSCMITIMGIAAEKNAYQMGEVEGTVEKIMAEAPRRVAALNVSLKLSGHQLSEAEKKHLETAAINCPVAKSIHPDIQLTLQFVYE